MKLPKGAENSGEIVRATKMLGGMKAIQARLKTCKTKNVDCETQRKELLRDVEAITAVLSEMNPPHDDVTQTQLENWGETAKTINAGMPDLTERVKEFTKECCENGEKDDADMMGQGLSKTVKSPSPEQKGPTMGF